MKKEIWIRLCRNRQAVLGMILLVLMMIPVFTSGLYLNYDDDVIKQDVSIALLNPSREHLFGTDFLGRDLFARMMWGGKTSLSIAIIVAIIQIFPGLILGAVAGYYGGWIDDLIMRALDIFTSIPGMLMTIVIVAALGTGTLNLVIAMLISSIPNYARITRSQVLQVKNYEFIEAAKMSGTSDFKIIAKHIVPNILAPIIVEFSMSIGDVIMKISALSFLGLGTQPPAPEWGAILSDGQGYISRSIWGVLFPGIFIGVAVLAFNFIGDGLRDALDPKLKD